MIPLRRGNLYDDINLRKGNQSFTRLCLDYFVLVPCPPFYGLANKDVLFTVYLVSREFNIEGAHPVKIVKKISEHFLVSYCTCLY